MPDPTTNKPAAVQLYALTPDGDRVPLRADADGNLILAATIDTSGLALNVSVDGLETLITSSNAKLDTVHADLNNGVAAANILGSIDAGVSQISADISALMSALQDPTTYTAITPSDSTNVTSVCTKGIFVAVTGNVNITGVGGSAVSLGTQVAGTTIPGALSRVNAATTATVFGLSGP